MALTKITRGVIKANENYDTHNINSTGIVTAVSANFTGNVSIGGTLTYQDVTNIDSVGIITARAGVDVNNGHIVLDSGYSLQWSDSHERIEQSDGKLEFFTNNTEKVTISGSSLGINRTTPVAPISARRTDAGGTGTSGVIAEFANSSGYGVWFGQSSASGASWGATTGDFYWNTGGLSSPVERLRITSGGQLLVSGQAALTSTSLSHPIQVASASDANAIAIIGRAADDIGELSFYEADKSTKLGELQYRQDHLNFRHRVGDIRFATGGVSERLRITSAGNVGINETSPDTNLHISRSASQNDTHGILKVESTSTSTGAATNAGIIVKNRYGWAQFMQWEEHGLRIGPRSTTTGGEGKVTVTYGADSTGAVINENGVVTMPQQCGFHVVLHTSQTLTNNGTVNLWDTDASDSRSYIKNMTFNAGRFVAPVSGLYYFTAQLLLSGVQSNDDNIHIAWTTGSGNDTFAYWNTRHDGASANGNYGYGGYLPVTGSTTVYLSANEIFGIRANFTGNIGVHGTDANWGHWSGFLVG